MESFRGEYRENMLINSEVLPDEIQPRWALYFVQAQI